ncbi:[NiFe]-hydrogenase assembly chaperone HybE [Rhodovulum euryhalinum]|uniref:[NiFe] hydrogenase assembly HybE family chaperone n=1 Tax=Rhodovulum euryhalinum TaxID=35805 RepID=A0A4R2KJ16_9RHOB|nr:[NiFe]-hydrogenase assembly chaperone HybE [Rhodovulum euryhalinum]TCO70556.1 [NiFe] hydrogenase assembly HybE family chaperone [Rhodovulum euryhalinum]
MSLRFEGSYGGAADRIGPAAIMECKICWTVYDPADGDAFRQVLPGTPFAALPDDWTCPTCAAPRDQFMVRTDPSAPDLAARTAPLVADFREIWNGKMRDVPLCNKALHVEAVGFIAHEGRPLGVLVTPWCMNLVLLPAEGEDWSDLVPGAKEVVAFPSGDYEVLHNVRPMVGGYKACSLFSPMSDFASQMQAVEVARAVMTELFRPENRAETDRALDIRAARAAELAPPPEAPAAPSRRAVISAGLAPDGDPGREP